MTRRRATTPHLLIPVLLAATVPLAQAQSPAEVGVYAEHHGGNVIYRYELANRGPQAVRAFRLGCDCPGTGVAPGQLSTLPPGASPAHGDGRGTWYDLPADAVSAPPGWRARLLWPSGAGGYWIEWYATAPGPEAGVAPGSTLAGFSVEAGGADVAFLEADVSIEGASAQRLRLLDRTPPQLALQARGTRPGPDAASVRIVAHVTDDRDPDPRVTLQAIEREAAGSGAPADRTVAYTVTYAALDASGNRATARTRVSMPAPEAGPGGQQAPSVPRLLRLAVMP